MGHHAGAVAHGIIEGDHIAHLHILCFQSMADDQVTALDLRVHGVRQNDHGEHAADGRNFLFINIAFCDQGQIDDQNRQQDHTQDRADDGQDLLLGISGSILGILTHKGHLWVVFRYLRQNI